jgi:hypothetical protein
MPSPAVLMIAWLVGSCGGAHSGEHAGVDTPGGGVVEPATAAERQVLEALDTLPAGTARRFGNSVVVAEAPYFAASGRRCRGLTITPAGGRPGARRLACRQDGRWLYVPMVLIAPAD